IPHHPQKARTDSDGAHRAPDNRRGVRRAIDNRSRPRMGNLSNLETRIMQRWRYIGFPAVALVTLALAGRLPAQEAAKKAGAPAAEATKGAPEATQGIAPAATATQGVAPASELRPNVQFGAGANAAGG